MNARGEGFETYIEDLFNENGPFGRNKIQSELSKIRVAREKKPNDYMEEKIDSLNYENPALKNRPPLLNFGMKVFGNEISYWNMEGDEEIKDMMKKINPLYHVNKVLSGKVY